VYQKENRVNVLQAITNIANDGGVLVPLIDTRILDIYYSCPIIVIIG